MTDADTIRFLRRRVERLMRLLDDAPPSTEHASTRLEVVVLRARNALLTERLRLAEKSAEVGSD